MALFRVDDAQVRDAVTGEFRDELIGQPVKVVLRDTTTAAPIFDSVGDPIPGSVLNVTAVRTVPRFWVDEDDPSDLYLDWLDEGSGARGPVDFDKVLRDAAQAAAASAATAAGAAVTAQGAAEAVLATIPPGGTTGQFLAKASNADRHTAWVTGGGGGGGVTAHSQLSGLTTGDDHTQYHNDARGDARYYTKSQVDSAVASAATQTSASDRARANHTGTQPIGSVTNLETELAARAPVSHAHNASTDLTSGTVPLARLGTNTPSGALFLRGDNTWASAGGEGGGGPVAWDDVADKPTTFAPSAHTHAASETTSGTFDPARIPTLPSTRVGLGAVDNTSDLAKPISTATQTALETKAADSAVVKLTGNQTVAGVKTFSSAPVVPDASFAQAKVSGLPAALTGKVTGLNGLTGIWKGSQSAYDALGTYDSNVLYLVTGA